MENTVPTFKNEESTTQGNPAVVPQKDIEKQAQPVGFVRTMKKDIAEAINKQNESFVSIALAEEKKEQARKKELEEKAKIEASKQVQAPTPKRVGRLTVVIILILILVAVGLAYKFVLPKISSFKVASTPEITTTIPEPAPLAPAIITPQYEKRLTINKNTPELIFATIALERTTGLASGTIKNLYFTEEISSNGGNSSENTISSRRLLTFVNTEIPESFIRSLETPFMVGLIGEENSIATPFIILKVSSYETGLAGMLSWEKSLPQAFDTIFGTKFSANILVNTKFRDIIVSGKDARSFDIRTNNTIIYSFANTDTIIIAGSSTALSTLMQFVSKN